MSVYFRDVSDSVRRHDWNRGRRVLVDLDLRGDDVLQPHIHDPVYVCTTVNVRREVAEEF